MSDELLEVEPWKALQTRLPEQIAFAVVCDAEGKPNIITLGWFMPVSHDPPMVAIAVGKTRYTHELMSARGDFVFCWPTEEMADAMVLCGTRSGRDVDKLSATGLRTAPAANIRPPLLPDCAANLECKAAGSIEAGDHTIFVGQIVAAYVSSSTSRTLYTLGPSEFGPVAPAGQQKKFP